MRSPSVPSALSRRSFVVKAALAAVGGVGALRAAARAQAPDKPTASPALAENVSLRQLMTPEQFKAAGLNKLSSDELANLERFLKGYRDQTVEAVAKETEQRAQPGRNRAPGDTGKFIQAHIKGPFNGLNGRTLITLDNGSVWRQGNDDRVSVHLDSPEVILVRSAFGYRMFVVGLTKPFYVRQILQN